MKTRTSKYIVNTHGVYERAAETKDSIYFINHRNKDNSSKVIMCDRKLSLKHNDILAYDCLIADKNNFTWVSKKLPKKFGRK